MRLSELKSGDFTGNNTFDFVLPIGATEQHGPYAPFGTDTYIINYLIVELPRFGGQLRAIGIKLHKHLPFHTSWAKNNRLKNAADADCTSPQ